MGLINLYVDVMKNYMNEILQRITFQTVLRESIKIHSWRRWSEKEPGKKEYYHPRRRLWSQGDYVSYALLNLQSNHEPQARSLPSQH